MYERARALGAGTKSRTILRAAADDGVTTRGLRAMWVRSVVSVFVLDLCEVQLLEGVHVFCLPRFSLMPAIPLSHRRGTTPRASRPHIPGSSRRVAEFLQLTHADVPRKAGYGCDG